MKFLLLLSFTMCAVFSLKLNENILFESKCVVKVLKNVPYKKNDFILIMPFVEIDERFFLSLLLELKRPVIIAKKFLNSFSELRPIKPSAHFIYIDNIENFQTSFLKLNTTHQNWHPSSKWIIFFQSAQTTKKNVTLTVTKIMKKIHVYDFEILIYDHLNVAVNIFTWLPFDKVNKCRKYFNITQIDSCQPRNATLSTFAKRPVRKIPTKLPKDCVFKVCGFHWPPYAYEDPKTMQRESNNTVKYSVAFVGGFHVHTVQTLAYRYAIRVKYVPVEEGSRWGMVLDNGTWTGALGALQSSKAEAAIGGALQTVFRFLVFDCSTTFNPTFFKFFVPLPDKVPHWKSFFNIFSPSLWIFLVTVYVCMPITIRFLSTLSPINENSYFKNVITCFFTLWPIAVGSSSHCIPKSLTVRLAFLLWLIYNFHITLVYSSSLLSVMTTPTYGKRIKTIRELSESNYKLTVVKQFLQISNMMDEELKTVIQKKYTPSSGDFSEDIRRSITKKDIVIFDPLHHFMVAAKENIVQIYTLNDVVRLNNGIYVKRGSIFKPFLDDIQLAVLENGMFIKWMTDMFRTYKKHHNLNYENYVRSLTLQQHSGSFYFLIFGLSLSALVFMVEIICCKKNNNKKLTLRTIKN